MSTPCSRLLLATVLTASALLPAASSQARSNYVRETSYGGIQFSESDRFAQAAGDTVAMAVDPPSGGLFAVGDADAGDLYAYRFDAAGRQRARFAVDFATTAVAVGPGGEVFVGTKKGAVIRYSAAGAKVGQFDAGAPVVAMAAGVDGSVYVGFSTSVVRFSSAGMRTGSFGGAGKVGGVAVDGAGGVYVADPGRRRIEVFDAGGTLLRTVGGPDGASGGLEQPGGIGVDGAGNVYVRDTTGGGFDIKRFASDGRPEGSLSTGLFDTVSKGAQDSPSEPVLLAVTRAGDVYFTPQNPDIDRVPAAVVPAPRLRIDDSKRGVPQYDDLQPLAASVGRSLTLQADVFRSLSTPSQASVSLTPGLTLAQGTPATQPVAVPLAQSFLAVRWPLNVTQRGRQLATVAVTGTGPDGEPTRMAKVLPIYGIDGPRLRIEGAATRRGASYALVAITLDLGKTKVAKADRAALIQRTLSDAIDVQASARVGGRKLEELDFRVGETATGVCIPFVVRGTPKLTVRAATTAGFGGEDRFRKATAKRSVTPTSRPRTALLKACYRAIDLA